MKLALGTVQFGLDYGVSNQQGQVSKAQVKEILLEAKSLGIDTLDCAAAYGESERTLGEQIVDSDYDIITKIPELTREQTSIISSFEQSLQRLQKKSIHGLLFHQADNLITHPKSIALFQQLQTLKQQQRVEHIGVSVYNPEQLRHIAAHYPIDIAQVPINIFDQRFLADEMIDLCREKHIRLHVRSLFLQGLILIKEIDLPQYFAPYKDKLLAFSQLAEHLGCSKLALALAIVAPNSHSYADVIDKIVVGVCNKKQLSEIVQAYEQASTLGVTIEELRSVADTRLELINPSLWSLE